MTALTNIKTTVQLSANKIVRDVSDIISTPTFSATAGPATYTITDHDLSFVPNAALLAQVNAFDTYNLDGAVGGLYNALLGVFNSVSPAGNTNLTFTLGSNLVTGISVYDMAVGCQCFARLNLDSSPMTSSAPWPIVTSVNPNTGAFTISSNATQSGSAFAAFGLVADGKTGPGHYICNMGFTKDFPRDTRWDWSFPSEYQAGVYAYPDLCIGLGAPGYYPVPPQVPTAHHPNDFTTLTLKFAAQAVTDHFLGDDIDCLIETWITNTATPANGSAPGVLMNEIGFMAYTPPLLWTTIKGFPHNFSGVVAGFSVYVATRAGTPGTATPPFTLIVPTTPDFSQPLNLLDGQMWTIDFATILKKLVALGLISNTNWVVGYAFGPEIYQGSGTMSVSTFDWTWV